jgi:hypothetical protein
MMAIVDYREKYNTPQVKNANDKLLAALKTLEKLTKEEREAVSFFVTGGRINLTVLVREAGKLE